MYVSFEPLRFDITKLVAHIHEHTYSNILWVHAVEYLLKSCEDFMGSLIEHEDSLMVIFTCSYILTYKISFLFRTEVVPAAVLRLCVP